MIGVNGSSESSAMIGEFTRESEDMNELVFHPDAIQNDISLLAKRPISVYDNNSYVAECSDGTKVVTKHCYSINTE